MLTARARKNAICLSGMKKAALTTSIQTSRPARITLRLPYRCAAFFIPERQIAFFLALAVSIGLVLGGTQALSRSFFSLLIPRGREAEYFSLYQACERGTSWLGTLVFGLVYQLTDSY